MSDEQSDISLTTGQRYQIVQSGAHLSVEESRGTTGISVTRCELSEGDVVTYRGRKPGLGDDYLYYDVFETRDGTEGTFVPESRGNADTDYLEGHSTE